MTKRRWMLGMVFGCLGLLLVLGPALAAEKPIKIGVVFIMSGPMGGYGKHGSQAVQLALDEINGQGGILGRKVEAIFEDDQMKVEQGVQVVKKFIDQDKVDFIIGPTSSAVALALAHVVQESKNRADPVGDQFPDRRPVQPVPVQHPEQRHDAFPGRGLFSGGQTV